MAKTMKAAVVREFGKDLYIEDAPVPEPGPGQIQVKIEACGVCHSDLHARNGDWAIKPNPPFIPGHEGVGYVSGVGAGVSHVKEGDLVGIPWLYSACGHCEQCMSGWETFCNEQQFTGYTVNGGFAEYAIADPNYVAHMPSNVPLLEVAPIICAGLTVYKAIKETETKPGDWLVISGVGGLGHLGVQYARAMGRKVIAVDIDDDKLALAKKHGAEITINAKNTDPGQFVQKEIGGAHGAVVTAVSPPAFKQAMEVVRRRGTISLVGMPPGDFPLSITSMVGMGITLRGSAVGTRMDMIEALDFAGRGQVKSTVTPDKLDNINNVFKRMEKGQIEGRIVIDMSS